MCNMSDPNRIRQILQTLGLPACDHQVELMQMYMAFHPTIPPSFLAKPLAIAQIKRAA